MRAASSSIPSADAVEPEVQAYVEGHFCLSTWHNLSFVIWSDRATVDAVQKIKRVTSEIQKKYPGGHSNVSFVTDGTPPPSAETRQAFAEVFDDRISQIRCLSTVVEGGGFWASGLRAAINGMRLDSSHHMKMKVHTSIDEVVAWLPAVHYEQTGTRVSPEALRQALQVFRAGYKA